MSRRVSQGWTNTKKGKNVSCSRTQHSDASEAQTRGPLVSSQALYHRATVLPKYLFRGVPVYKGLKHILVDLY